MSDQIETAADAQLESSTPATEPSEAQPTPTVEVASTPVAEVETPATSETETPAAEVETQPTAEAETEAAPEGQPEAQPAAAVGSLADLKPKQEVRGVVKNIQLFGAFIDLGVGVDGLLHISQLGNEDVKNVTDVLKVGDEVTVWVRKIDLENKRIDLTMRPMLALGWGELHEGMTVSGKVVKIERFGVFVEIGAERPGMIHVSELASGYVNAPEDVVKLNDEVTAKVIKVNRKKKQIDLSRKALEEPIVMPESEDDNEPAMTAMELALRNAMRGTEMGDVYAEAQKVKREKKQAANDKRRKDQEELLNRTLKNRVK
jgi:transcriptional accessory protein Tex/SPT6